MSEPNVHQLLDEYFETKARKDAAKTAKAEAERAVTKTEADFRIASDAASKAMTKGKATVHRGKVVTVDHYGTIQINEFI